MTASITSASSTEIVSTTTRVSGAIAVICRVASTPVMPGMFRSMTTTSGASSRDEPQRRLAVRRLADDLDALLLEQVAQPGPEEVVVVHEQDAQPSSSFSGRRSSVADVLTFVALSGRDDCSRRGLVKLTVLVDA